MSSSELRIVVDENIPFAEELFGPLGQLRTISGRAIDRSVALESDILIVRSITRVDAALLDSTPVRFVGTATIGRDHIDDAWCRAHGIPVADAAGSSRRSVAEYILAALLVGGIGPGDLLGLVGVGSIGSLVAEMASVLAIEVVTYDPPREERESGFISADRASLRRCRAISFSVPLTTDGPHTTHHLVDAEFLASLPDDTLLINTSRGGVVDSAALHRELATGRLRAVLDVWEGEPSIPIELLEHCLLATPHIAGYARDAKVRGAWMVARALCKSLGLPAPEQPSLPPAGIIDARNRTIEQITIDTVGIRTDDADLRQTFSLSTDDRRTAFDRLRKEYRVRREFGAWGVEGESDGLAAQLGFGRGSHHGRQSAIPSTPAR